MNRRFLWAAAALAAGPYLGTMAWTGTVRGEEAFYEQQQSAAGKYSVWLDRGAGSYYMDMEEYLTGVTAMQIPADYEPETLKAQAIIARTYIRRQMEAAGTSEIAESVLDLDYPEQKQLKEMWGSAAFPAYFEKVEEAVKATEGQVLTYEGELIDPMFFRLSAGMTRQGDFLHPYFQNVDCPEDMEAADFEETMNFSYGEAAAAINSIPEGGAGPRQVSPQDLPEGIQIISRDTAGYVEEIQIGNVVFTGEEIQYALGLSSSCFSVGASEEGLRFAVKGKGHGYGLSQHAANEKARAGWTAEDILGYFYKNISISE